MKTSNKLLLYFSLVVLLTITAIVGYSRITAFKYTESGKDITIKKDLPSYRAVKLIGNVKTTINHGTPSIEINGDENLLKAFEYEVKDGVLEMKYKGRKRPVTVQLSAETLDGLTVSAGATLQTSDTLKGETFQLETSAGSIANLLLDYRSVNCATSTGSQLNVKGGAQTFDLKSSSGSLVHAEDLKVAEGKVEMSSGSQATINIAKLLNVDLSSGAQLKYNGDPAISKINISSGALFHKMNE